MATGSAVQRGPNVYIYDEKGRQLSVVSSGSGFWPKRWVERLHRFDGQRRPRKLHIHLRREGAAKGCDACEISFYLDAALTMAG
jgi:hypothetical protein